MTSSPIWHPFTQHALFPDSIAIERAEGAMLYTKDGRAIVDGISSWWVNTHGHCHPKIVEAVRAQAGKLEQVIFAGFTHDPAEQLATKLLERTRRTLGPGLEHAFFSDSGSTAVEVALKMAIGFFKHTGQENRRSIVALEDGYHGDTFGAMAAGARSVFSAPYEPYLFDVTYIPPQAETFEKLLNEKGDTIAALILEPLVQGAGGMKMYSAETLKNLASLCKQHGVLLIADEVMTGFGRTGTFFACEQASIAPDLMCLSKGLTGGFLPMGLTLASQTIYGSFYAPDRARTFFHSSSFTGNALSCAAALASLKLWEEEPVLERIQAIEQSHQKAAEIFRKDKYVQDVRVKGSILALDISTPEAGYLSNLGTVLTPFYLENGVLLRPLGNCVYVLPPYCITHEELERIYNVIRRSLDYIRHAGSQQNDGSQRARLSGPAHC
ncbi:MAG: adenosylmethionine--8-amino-7-oxononanoate transaminase [Alphaproteobacteria bacterium]|nr:adenosylmethionine--8-amino-7-oxononanoate transaminase [Alphaproteobacteria bacterium]MCD8571438.1 adenosylmethionine--8-amino-7-oxononanoate transaminase [Alphaproteobacteria bacterium]